MAKVRRVDFHPAEWLAGTRRLTVIERGVYITICALIYDEGGPLDYSDDDIAHECRMPTEDMAKAILSLEEKGKIKRVRGRITNDRCEAELKKASERIAKAKLAGRAGGKSTQNRKSLENKDDQASERLSDAKADGQANAQASLKLTKNQEPRTNISSVPSDTPPSDTPPTDDPTGPDHEPTKKPKADKTVRRGSRLPQDWVLQDEWIDEAIRLGMSDRVAALEAGRFRDYWHSQPGQKGVKLDWKATWRNWCRSAVERQAQRAPPRPQQQTTADAMARAAEAATGGRPLVNGAQFAEGLFGEGEL